jgi:hypothetical protein
LTFEINCMLKLFLNQVAFGNESITILFNLFQTVVKFITG